MSYQFSDHNTVDRPCDLVSLYYIHEYSNCCATVELIIWGGNFSPDKPVHPRLALFPGHVNLKAWAWEQG